MGNNESAAFAVCGEPWKGGRGLPLGVYVSDGENLTLVPQRATACVSNMAAAGFRQRYGRFLYGHGRPGKWERGAVVRIARELSVKDWQVDNCIHLFEEGSTIPFISRYRKEATGGMNEVEVAAVANELDALTELQHRRDVIRQSTE